ncbi:hypothetical protein ACFY40_11730 [Streptomyces sp. NPDC012950]|uniref:hypothetical protein n=1 Tax=Streptomyces sp. NPDC012950 TaxID=3364858 RepID=UPI0036A3FEAB
MTAVTTGDRVVRPDCEFGEHTWCKLDPVCVDRTGRVPAGTPGAVEVFPPERCDCPCHKEAR